MYKYIIIGCRNFNIRSGKADVFVLCKSFGSCYWEKCLINTKKINKNIALFNSRNEANEVIKKLSLDCCISYCIEVGD